MIDKLQEQSKQEAKSKAVNALKEKHRQSRKPQPIAAFPFIETSLQIHTNSKHALISCVMKTFVELLLLIHCFFS